MKYKLFCCALSILFMLISKNISVANTYHITNTLNSGIGSLREAITNSNSHTGADTISFNIPVSDAGFNATNGTWTILLTTELPYFTGGFTFVDGNTQSNNQGNLNPYGPEIFIKTTASLNTCFLMASPNNSIRNIGISGFVYGVLFYNSTGTGNIIREMFLGTSFDGASAAPNQYGAAFSNGASGNSIINCLISGNTMAGIGISTATTNNIKGCKIGTDLNGTKKNPNSYGIAIDGASNNLIGGNTVSDRNIISGNINAGIVINGNSSSGNSIKGNYIGTNISGNDSLPNGNGVMLAGAKSNLIGGSTSQERNVISGNYQAGIVLNGTGTRNNNIKGNYIGVDITGSLSISNHTGVMLMSNSNKNTIGGTSSNERNVVSGNFEIGIYIEASDSNTVIGNYLGPDASGENMLVKNDTAIQGNGIELNTVSKYNVVGGTSSSERNIISGNRVYGLVYYGNSSFNNTSGNFIGTNVSGTKKLPNATGICVDGGSHHNTINNNLLSGNYSYGIFFVTTGTNYNVFKGNKIGVNSMITDTIPNYIGLIIAAGTKYNEIGGTSPGEGNLITGNYYNGIELADAGTDNNNISGNQIGSVNALPGNYNGIAIATNPQQNLIYRNTITKNKFTGIILFENASNNFIRQNYIGTDESGTADLGNGSSGIILVEGSSGNEIFQNKIAYNDTAGIILYGNDTRFNTISQNSIFQNSLTGIDIFPFGFNANDPGDIDSGPNDMMNSPVFTSTIYNPADGKLWLNGTIDYNVSNPAGIIIEVFKSIGDSMGYGQAIEYLGNAVVDASGHWFNAFPGATDGEKLLATATDLNGNTSEFSPNSLVISGIPETATDFLRINVNPNPINERCNIEIVLQQAKKLKIILTNNLGMIVLCIPEMNYSEGTTIQSLDIGDLPAGLYFLSVEANNFLKFIKLIKN